MSITTEVIKQPNAPMADVDIKMSNGKTRYNYLINFNAKKRRTVSGNEYNHSNKALIAGGISCVSATGLSTLIKNDSKITKSKITLTTFALTAPLIALGALADSVTNKERQKTADLISKVGPKHALLIDEDLKVSKNGKVYKTTNNGTKFSVAGITGAVVLSGISRLLFKKGVVKNEIFKRCGELYKFVSDQAPDDVVGFLIATFPLTITTLPLMISDLLNNNEERK